MVGNQSQNATISFAITVGKSLKKCPRVHFTQRGHILSHQKDPNWHPSQKSRRCYHRVISGIERGGDLRFLTLTSSKESPVSCQKSFRSLYKRLQRRGLIKGYIKVPELSRNGKQHLHVLFRGSYIEQAYLSHVWQELHKAKVIDIRRVHSSVDKRKLASDMASYMSKTNAFRYSWNWDWVWRGFCRDWTKLKRLWRSWNEATTNYSFDDLLRWWRLWLKGFWKPDLDTLLEPP